MVSRFAAVSVVLVVFSLVGVGAGALVVDPQGDILPSYTAGPPNPDLDVLSAEVVLDILNSTLTFSGTHAGPIGTTSGAIYVFGLNRGVGTERFQKATPKIGAGIFFDSVLMLRPDGTGQFNDTVTGANTPLPPGSVIISGNTISSVPLSLSLFPSQGFGPQDYTWNTWPRVGLGQNNQVSDFAPDASNVAVTIIPEPATLCLLALGALAIKRRR